MDRKFREHAIYLQIHLTLPANPEYMWLLRRLHGTKIMIPGIGVIKFGDRSDPRNVEIELLPNLTKRLLQARPEEPYHAYHKVRAIIGIVVEFFEGHPLLRRFLPKRDMSMMPTDVCVVPAHRKLPMSYDKPKPVTPQNEQFADTKISPSACVSGCDDFHRVVGVVTNEVDLPRSEYNDNLHTAILEP